MVALLEDVALVPRRCAVVAIGFQRLSLDPEGPYRSEGGAPIIKALNGFLDKVRPPGVLVVFSNYVLRDDMRDAGLLSENLVIKDGHMCASSPWVALDPRVRRIPADAVLTRNRPSAFFRSDLEGILRSRGVDTLILASASVDNALNATARDAFAR